MNYIINKMSYVKLTPLHSEFKEGYCYDENGVEFIEAYYFIDNLFTKSIKPMIYIYDVELCDSWISLSNNKLYSGKVLLKNKRLISSLNFFQRSAEILVNENPDYMYYITMTDNNIKLLQSLNFNPSLYIK